MRIFVSVPCIESSGDSSCKVSHKAHCSTKSQHEIYDDKENCSLEIFVLSVFVKIICVNCEEWHSKTTSSNRRIFWEEIEKYTNKNCRPDPESPSPFFSVRVFYHATNKEKKNDIAQEMPESTMEETVKDELSEESEKSNRIVVNSSVNDYFRIYPVDDCTEQWEYGYDIDRAFPVDILPIWHLEVELFHGMIIEFSLILQRAEYHIFYEKRFCWKIYTG